MKVFRDPVHGDILLPGPLLALVDTREFQRLRGVKMLGTAYLVYPGAVHSRFEHSLGTCWLTTRLLEGLGVEKKHFLAVQAAALLHDVTHIPFGHTFEDERRIFERHDTPARLRRFVPQGELGKALKAAGLLEPVLEILTEQAQPGWQFEIFSGTVCADLLDYLARDAYFCGLSQRYDERILRHFRINGQGQLYLDAYRGGLIREDVLSEVVNLLRLRYFLSERVYFHHTKTASGAMISRAVEQAVGLGLSLSELSKLTDERLLAWLEANYGQDTVVARLMDHLASRRVYKRAYVLTRRIGEERRAQFVERYHLQAETRRAAETALAEKLRLKPGELIVYCPARGMQLKEADVLLKIDEGPPRSMSELHLPEIQVLREKHQDLWKFYVFVAPHLMERAAAISQACEEYFLEANHLPGLRSGQLYLAL
ncbi:MAG: HD domain-containing protein [Candidatus Eremiobacteraeota bacterium]|nr:HD domain-containing protein [Candidatus Eremiobacteraeota bacterium]